MNVTKGQRWISQTEAQLGLGIVTAVSGRRITLHFPAVEQERIYATDNNALVRVIYRPGESITTMDERELTVIDIEEVGGLAFYKARDDHHNEHIIGEMELGSFVHFTSPRQRLISAQLDKDALFRLRIALLEQQHQWQRSEVRGLLGCRTDLIPHQLYIAAEVAQRHAPRVLLADEVGLGKTIEAGMIIHQQLLTARANRVLIVTPDSLQHQWLIELLRRFNLHFSLFDLERLQALDSSDGSNPFDSEQLVLCALSLLTENDDILQHACNAQWDLIVVDEAHHLHWSEQQVSKAYQSIEQLAGGNGGLLLLSATPEQAGLDGHFARLRLLDPARFHDLNTFIQEQQHYQQINTLVRQLLSAEQLQPELLASLRQWLGSDSQLVSTQADAQRDSIIRLLLDQHGTGRVMFRNTRAAITAFPERLLHAHPQPLPALYKTDDEHTPPPYPEQQFEAEQWIVEDPRVDWLKQFLKGIRPHKVLIICAHADTATALEYHLHMRVGIRCSAFHEGLSLIERDRAAAWFADSDSGAQALVCSEIGSEGRNFQFAQHLVLFDLPQSPDLLEQRIGRLDRIGQQGAINIHVPYLCNSAQEVLFRWYHQGMNVFVDSCAAAQAILQHFQPALSDQMQHCDSQLTSLIEQTRTYTEATRRSLQQGRDPLLELNSCNGERAEALITTIRNSQDEEQFMPFLEQLFDQIGIDYDFHSPHARVLRPSEHMLIDHLPGLSDSGLTITVNRQQALEREDMTYLSWEHPMLHAIVEAILHSELGSTALVSMQVKSLPPGTLLLEAIYSANCLASAALQLERYLASKPVRVLLNASGQDFSSALSHQQLNQLTTKVKRAAGQTIIKRVHQQLDTMLDQAETIAASHLPDIIATATATMQRDLGSELQRLQSLRRVNTSIRPTEIAFMEQRIASSSEHLARTTLQLTGLRLIINT